MEKNNLAPDLIDENRSSTAQLKLFEITDLRGYFQKKSFSRKSAHEGLKLITKTFKYGKYLLGIH